MQLDECDLEGIDFVSTAPFQRTAPEDDWARAAQQGTIPGELFELYRRARFLSFGASPPFLSDEDNLLFSYFGLVIRSIQESLVDAHEQAISFAANFIEVLNRTTRRADDLVVVLGHFVQEDRERPSTAFADDFLLLGHLSLSR